MIPESSLENTSEDSSDDSSEYSPEGTPEGTKKKPKCYNTYDKDFYQAYLVTEKITGKIKIGSIIGFYLKSWRNEKRKRIRKFGKVIGNIFNYRNIINNYKSIYNFNNNKKVSFDPTLHFFNICNTDYINYYIFRENSNFYFSYYVYVYNSKLISYLENRLKFDSTKKILNLIKNFIDFTIDTKKKYKNQDTINKILSFDYRNLNINEYNLLNLFLDSLVKENKINLRNFEDKKPIHIADLLKNLEKQIIDTINKLKKKIENYYKINDFKKEEIITDVDETDDDINSSTYTYTDSSTYSSTNTKKIVNNKKIINTKNKKNNKIPWLILIISVSVVLIVIIIIFANMGKTNNKVIENDEF